jgi:hypothetical protein
MEINPYAATTSSAEAVWAANDDAELTRRKYLSHEASIQSVGLLYIVGAAFSMLYGVGIVFAMLYSQTAPATGIPASVDFSEIAIGLVVCAVGLLQAYAGWSMRTLNASGKPIAILLTVFGLLGIPIGTLISLSILYLLLSEKGRMVFSPEYKAVIAATPHIRYRTSLLNWILLFLFLAVVVGLVTYAVLTAKAAPSYRF